MRYLKVRNWERFQAYKDDRRVSWIKAHVGLLENYEFGLLPDATKSHLIGIWLLAALKANKIPADPVWIGKQIQATTPVDLETLISFGFLQYAEINSTSNERTEKELPKIENVPRGEDIHREEAGVYAPDPDAIDRLDADIASEEKRFNGLMLGIRDSGEDVQEVLDSLPRPKDRAPFSARHWLATGLSGIARKESALTVLRLTCDALEAWKRNQGKPSKPRKGAAPSWDRPDTTQADLDARAVRWIDGQDFMPIHTRHEIELIAGDSPEDIQGAVATILFARNPHLRGPAETRGPEVAA